MSMRPGMVYFGGLSSVHFFFVVVVRGICAFPTNAYTVPGLVVACFWGIQGELPAVVGNWVLRV